MQLTEVAISPPDEMLELALPLDPEEELGMLVVSNVALDRGDTDSGNVDVPAIDVVSFGESVHDACIDGVAVDDLDLGEADTLFKSGRSTDSRDHHQLDELLGLDGELAALGLFETVLGGGNLFRRERFEELGSQVRPVCMEMMGNVPLAAWPARTPPPWPYQERGSRGHA